MRAENDVRRAHLERALAERYSIRREAGHGGMAVVYEALDLRYNRTVAIKVVHGGHSSPGENSRFLREIQIAAKLNHPHILPVLDSGEAGGMAYYVMPFVGGETLRQRMQREPKLSIGEALRITREVAQALAYAHEQGVVHRDMKPENIMLAEGVAVVTDFGIARAFESGGGETLTRAGMLMGTPSYMSPEQATGERALDGRSDLYAIGCILFEMLANEPPYKADSLFALLSRHAVAPIPSIRQFRPELPDELDAAIARAMAKEPADRFPTINAFAAALEELPSGAGFTPSRSVATITPRRRSRAVLATAALLVVAGGVWGWTKFSSDPSSVTTESPVVAVLPFEHIGPPEDSYVTDGISDEVSNRIAEIAGIRVISRASAMQYDLRQKSLADVAKNLHADFVVIGSIRVDHRPKGPSLIRVSPKVVRVTDGSDIWADQFDAELQPGKIFEVQSRIARNVAEALHVSMRPESRVAQQTNLTTNLDAYRFFLRGNLHMAQFLVRNEQAAAIDMYERAVALDTNFALAYARLAQATATYYSLFDRTPARLQRLLSAVEHAQRLAPNDVETQIARGHLALFGQRNLPLATKEYTAALARQPNNAQLHWAVGFAQRQRGDMANALLNFRAASALDPRSAMMLFEASTIPFLEHRPDETLTMLSRVLEIAPDFLPALSGRPAVMLSSGRFGDARRELEKLAPMGEAVVVHLLGEPMRRPFWDLIFPDSLGRVIQSLSLTGPMLDSLGYYHAKGAWYRNQNRPAIADAYFDSLRTTLSNRMTHRPGEISEYLFLAVARLELRDSIGARAAADSALIRDPLGRDALRGGFVLLDAARIYARLGLVDQSITLLEKLSRIPSPMSPELLAADPAFARLRSDARFRPLVNGRP